MFTSEQQALIEIQKLDLDIAKIQIAMAEHESRKKIAVVREKMAQADALLEKFEGERHGLDQKITAQQDEVELLNAKLSADSARSAAGVGAREAGHLQRDIDAMRRRIDALEYQELGLMEQRDELTTKIDLVTGKRAEIEAIQEDLTERFRSLSQHAQARIAELIKRKAKLSQVVNEPLVARYEHLAPTKGGIGIGVLQSNGRCSACNMTLAVGQVAELLAGEDFGTCPQCRRILVVGTPDAPAGDA